MKRGLHKTIKRSCEKRLFPYKEAPLKCEEGTSQLASVVTEHISRKGRVRLTRLILGNGWSIQELARVIGVTRRAIYFWLDPRETHPNNSHLEDLLNLAIKTDGQSASKILLDEVNQFRLAVDEKILGQISGGGK